MKRREFIKYTVLGVCFLLLCSPGLALPGTDEADSAANKPNILFIMTDQQHLGMVSCRGNKNLKTPALDKLAASGIRFDRAYCANPVCGPSRISLQLGLMPSAVGVQSNYNSNEAKVPRSIAANSIGPLLQRAGYKCAMGGKVHLPKTLWEDVALESWELLDKYSRESLAKNCVEYLKQPHEKPFILFASFINPHDICYMAYFKHTRESLVEKRFNMLDDTLRENGFEPFKTVKALDDFVEKHCPELPDNFEIPENEPEAITTLLGEKGREFRLFARENWGEKMWRLHRWMYARLIERVDKNIGKVLDALQQSEYADNTIVIFTSDHGDMDSAHRSEHKSLPYEESAGVPFIMSYPGKIPAGVVDDKHFINSGIDLLATICDYAGIEKPAYLPGQSIRPVAEGKKPRNWRDYVVTECQNSRMIARGSFKYMVFDHGKNREFLVDLRNDPGEMENLADNDKYKKQLNQMRKLLCSWIDEVDDKIGKKYMIATTSQ